MQPIPLDLVRAGRDVTEPTLSPSGERVAFVARTGGVAAISTIDLGASPVERTLTFSTAPAPGRGLGGGCFTWVVGADGAEAIAYVGNDGELWLQNGMDVRRMTDLGRSVRAPAVAERRGARMAEPSTALAYVVDEAEVWVLDLATGHSRRIDDGGHEFCFDPAVSPDDSVVSWQAWSPPDMAWDSAVRVDLELSTGVVTERGVVDGAVQQPRFTPDGRRVEVHDGSGWLNVYVDGIPVVAEPLEQAGPTWGMGNRSFAFDDDARRMAFTRNEAGHGALYVTDLQTGEIERLGRGVHGHLSWVGESLVAVRSGAMTPTCIVHHDMTSGERRVVAHTQPDVWVRDDLPEPDIHEIETADGVVHARRFVAGGGRVLVWIHGGPTDQWQVDWRPRITFWWSRGWDVLVVDPRGTTGHGREYQQALHGSWGRVDVDDTAAMIRHAHGEGWATPASTVVIGGSSGGLTVLGVLADHADLVAGGVASYPVSDLRALTEVTHRFEAHYTDTLVAPNDGSAESEAAFDRLSPISRAESIRSPLLIFHGTDDPVVPVAQSEVLAARVNASGGSIDLVLYDGEGHGFRQPDNVIDEHRRTEDFLRRVTTDS